MPPGFWNKLSLRTRESKTPLLLIIGHFSRRPKSDGEEEECDRNSPVSSSSSEPPQNWAKLIHKSAPATQFGTKKKKALLLIS